MLNTDSRMPGTLPISTLLSQALVAFTIEFDNESEHLLPNWTTRHGSDRSAAKVWLVSLAMWANCLRFVGEEPVTLQELEKRARTKTNLDGMRRWGYIFIHKDPGAKTTLLRAPPKGLKAREVLRSLFGVIEERWGSRFGKDAVHRLRETLWAIAKELNVDLPDCLPILGYGMLSRGPLAERPPAERETRQDQLSLDALLARVLLAFALEFERESRLSLAISANLLRVLDEKGVPVRELPALSGVSKEAISMAMGILTKAGVALVQADPAGSRFRIASLTGLGLEVHAAYRRMLAGVERSWEWRFGKDRIRALREALEALVGDGGEASRLWEDLDAYPDGWRARVRKPLTLPHYPMVLHRGGFPDGS